ncbi:endonuclease/exonuclease/phosphatase family protein [Halobaculum limi]|uniref:endonuclease/exonuclease/phosphatase family protein n=1 Tax=Halobaculum limi TaxID=3031916 RepID=UPI002404BEA5|nr:endonuclease/exonuclease/phosphatase family protein [Halobaculum sp. YSMS11]
MSPNGTESGGSRRAFLRGLAGVGIGVAGTSGATAVTARNSPRPTVLTQNLYFGFDLSPLLVADSLRGFRRIVGGFVDDLDPAVYRARAEGIAASVAAADADVVALQEATLFRVQRPSDYATRGGGAATEVAVDLLAEVETALDRRGLDFDRAAVTTTSDAELPGTTADGTADLRITDRNALLVRSGIDVERRVRRRFDTSVGFQIPETDQTVALRRGYARADLSMDGLAFTAVSTHLESVSSFMRYLQASELLDALPRGRRVILAGDLNSGPNTDSAAYDLLTESFTDPFVRLRYRGGRTCCQSATLRNDRSNLDRRIDAVLRRGRLRATAVDRVNHRRADRVTVQRDGEDDSISLWPSDHAGVVATFRDR